MAQAATDLAETTPSQLGDAFQGGFRRQAAQGPEAFAHNPWGAALPGWEGWNLPVARRRRAERLHEPAPPRRGRARPGGPIPPDRPAGGPARGGGGGLRPDERPARARGLQLAGHVTQIEIVTRGQAAAAVATEALTTSQDVLSTRFVSRP